MGNDRISIIHEVTMDTLATIKSNTQSVTPEEVRSQIMENVRGAVRLENIVREKGEKIRLAETLLPQQVAWALSELHPICLVETIDGVSDDTGKILGMYRLREKLKEFMLLLKTSLKSWQGNTIH